MGSTTDTYPGDGLFVVVPAHNEARLVGAVVAELKSRFEDVVVVDDGSEDGTAERASTAGAIVLRHPINLGQGAALQTGILYALRSGARLIATFDADGQHSAADLLRMAEAIASTGADVALGSRFLGSAPGMSAARRALLAVVILFTRWSTGLRLTDSHNGLRLFTREAATAIRITQNRMAHASEIIEEIASQGLRFVEVPVTVRYTEYASLKGQRLLDAFGVLGEILAGKIAR